MKFEGNTIECEDCEIVINENDNAAHPEEDADRCRACSAARYNDFIKQPCKLCNKPLGKGDLWVDEDMENYAHKVCGEKDNIKHKDQWGEPQY